MQIRKKKKYANCNKFQQTNERCVTGNNREKKSQTFVIAKEP